MEERLAALRTIPLSNMAPLHADRLQTEEEALKLFALQQKVHGIPSLRATPPCPENARVAQHSPPLLHASRVPRIEARCR